MSGASPPSGVDPGRRDPPQNQPSDASRGYSSGRGETAADRAGVEHPFDPTYHLSEREYEQGHFSPRHAEVMSYRRLKMTDLTYTVMNNRARIVPFTGHHAPPHAPRAAKAPSADQGGRT
ncbi:hypothetical protein ACIBTZ_09455 [Micromonospora sp. NPDC049460]|uniref:hypothetical protein n=1 Tax=Micromonospora sp. NPDC049460 TaxID=3364272 RepID=UPI0037AB50EC